MRVASPLWLWTSWPFWSGIKTLERLRSGSLSLSLSSSLRYRIARAHPQMSHFNSSFGIANPRTFSSQMGGSAPMEDGSTNMQSSHLDGIDFTFDFPESRFSYDGGTLHNTTGLQPESGPVSIFHSHDEKPLTSIILCRSVHHCRYREHIRQQLPQRSRHDRCHRINFRPRPTSSH
jgi:hypothetical protein